jgi:hypothetical protein
LLHSTVTLGGSTHKSKASHYLGWAEEYRLWQRLSEHGAIGSTNPAIVRAFLSRGASLHVVRVWPDGGHALERYLKSMGMGPRLCPVCRMGSDPSHFPTTQSIRLMTRGSGRLPSLGRAMKAIGAKPSGMSVSRRGPSPLRLTPLSRTSSVGIMLSSATEPIGGNASNARARQDNGGSGSASTRQRSGSSE